MMPRLILLLSPVSALLAACAQPPQLAPPGSAVADEASAIALAQTECTRDLGTAPSDEWKAQLVDGVWWVALGYEAEIRIDAATGKPGDCEQTIIVG